MTAEEIKELAQQLALLLSPRSPPYLIGKQLYIKTSTAVCSSVAAVLAISGNANRVGLFASVSGNAICQILQAGMVNTMYGFALNSANPTLELNINDHGVLPQLDWTATSTTVSTGGVTFIELLWKPE